MAATFSVGASGKSSDVHVRKLWKKNVKVIYVIVVDLKQAFDYEPYKNILQVSTRKEIAKTALQRKNIVWTLWIQTEN